MINVWDRESKLFDIGRGTKQGDPLSPILFNAVLEHLMRPLKQKWAEKGLGMHLMHPSGQALTNLRFADDLLLVASSAADLKKMLEDLMPAAQASGLELHPDKTNSRLEPQPQQSDQPDHSSGSARAANQQRPRSTFNVDQHRLRELQWKYLRHQITSQQHPRNNS